MSAWAGLDILPEQRLLLFCIRTRLDAHARRCAQELAARRDLDWSRFVALAIRHGVAPLAHAHIDALACGKMPAPLRGELETRNKAVAFRNLWLTGELLRLDRAFAAKGLRPVWFKGPVLAQQIYANVLMREFSDLDLFAPPDRLGCATRALKACGYEPVHALASSRHERLLRRLSNELCFVNPVSGVCVDLHWALTENDYSFAARAPLATCAIELGGRSILTFGPEETLCYLCFHGSKHGWAAFRHMSDVADFIRRRPDLDWDRLMSGRLPIGAPRMLQLGLVLARASLAAPLPPAVAAWAESDRRVCAIARRIRARRDLPATLFEPWTYLAVMPRGDRLRYLAAAVLRPTPLELDAVLLPDRLFFLYALLRYLRLARKYGLTLLTRSRRAGPPRATGPEISPHRRGSGLRRPRSAP
ncbi:nucleotidyltransferase family protein [Methylocystis sp. IM3]|uniref:nucleotidyltransferase domain-containing protein n=1 Tax=unclassified Methylocystis TaxID=2625913 RepID=UPI00311A7C7A